MEYKHKFFTDCEEAQEFAKNQRFSVITVLRRYKYINTKYTQKYKYHCYVSWVEFKDKSEKDYYYECEVTCNVREETLRTELFLSHIAYLTDKRVNSYLNTQIRTRTDEYERYEAAWERERKKLEAYYQNPQDPQFR